MARCTHARLRPWLIGNDRQVADIDDLIAESRLSRKRLSRAVDRAREVNDRIRAAREQRQQGVEMDSLPRETEDTEPDAAARR
jgi:hypothetical protein